MKYQIGDRVIIKKDASKTMSDLSLISEREWIDFENQICIIKNIAFGKNQWVVAREKDMKYTWFSEACFEYCDLQFQQMLEIENSL